MKTHTNKPSEEAKEQAASMSEMADAMRKNFEHAMRTGLKFQEEAGRWWSSVFNPATCAQQWQDQFSTATRTANSILPLAQKPTEEIMGLIEKNSRSSAELMKKALEASQAPVITESQAKWSEFWTCSLGVMRTNAEAMTQISSNAIESWTDFIRAKTEAAGKTA